MKTGFIGLPSLEPNEYPSPRSVYLNLTVFEFVKIADTHPLGHKLRARLTDDLRIKALEGKLIHNGAGASRFSLGSLIAWWLWRANNVGVEAADADLEVFLENDHATYLRTQWVYGPEVAKTICVTEEIKVVSFLDMPYCWEKVNASQYVNLLSNDRHFVQSAAIISEVQGPKIYQEEPVFDEEEIALKRTLRSVALLLNAVTGVVSTPGLSTGYAAEHVPMGPFGGWAGSVGVTDVFSDSLVSKLDEHHASDVRSLFKGYQRLRAPWKKRILRSLSRLGQAKARDDMNDKALDLGIALEMVLLSDSRKERLPGQLHNHFRLRGSWLLGSTYEERKVLYQELGHIYTQRSQVAHTGVLKSPKNGDLTEINSSVIRHISLAERILRKLIIDGPPEDWNPLVLGVSQG